MAHILVVEDEEKLSNLLKDYLIASGFEVSCILRGDEVEPWLAKHHADAIILDVMLPGKDGTNICTNIPIHTDCNKTNINKNPILLNR